MARSSTAATYPPLGPRTIHQRRWSRALNASSSSRTTAVSASKWVFKAPDGSLGRVMPPRSTFSAVAAAALDGPDWLRARRRAAGERFEAMELPTEAEEVWRYSRISDLDLEAYRPAGATSDAGV